MQRQDISDINAVKTPKKPKASFQTEDSALLLGVANVQKATQQAQHAAGPLTAVRQLFDGLLNWLRGTNGVADGRTRPERWCPEEGANWLSQLFFFYANSLVQLGSRKHLEQADLWDTARRDEPERLWTSFERHLRATATAASPQGVVWQALYRQHGRVFAITGGIKLVHDCIMFTQPFILEQLLNHLTSNSDRLVALGLAFALLVAAMLEALTVNIYFNMLFRMSLHTKTQLLETLYRKSLRVSSAVKSALGVGPIVNLQSNDAAKLWTMPTYLHMVWNGPFQIIVVMLMLIRVLTVWPALAGLAVTVAIIPLTMLLGKLLTAVRRESVAAADQRVKLMTEVLTGIKAIKLYAWEEPYLQRISQLRETELRAIRKTQLLSMINSSIFNVGPVLVSLAAFGVYAALGHPLTASVAFPSLALFNLLRFPIVMIPQQIMNLIAATVGIARIQRFIDSEDMAGVQRITFGNHSNNRRTSGSKHSSTSHSHYSPRSSSSNPVSELPPVALVPVDSATETDLHGQDPGSNLVPSVQVENGSFAWDAEGQPVLQDISLSVPQGSLVIVVGPVGSGKSSLLNAVLGEMAAVGSNKAAVTVAGSMAYTAQDPWIQNATLRNNVLMGHHFDAERYQRAIDASCLEKDLQILPAGDASEIGEKGINLSGGQKHRVALARAVYAGADLYLLDDPLSAVDVHVGRHIFEACICGELADKTRLLVTHQLQYLPYADMVVVMLHGRIAHTGTYTDLLAQGVDLAAFVPAKVQGESSETEADTEQEQQQQQEQDFVHVRSPVMSPRASAATAADTSSSAHDSSNSSSSHAVPLKPLKSFSDVITIELPGSVLARSGGSFASHKPRKVGQTLDSVAAAAEEIAAAAAVADGSSGSSDCAVAAAAGAYHGPSTVSRNVHSSSKLQLETIADVEFEQEVGLSTVETATLDTPFSTAATAGAVRVDADAGDAANAAAAKGGIDANASATASDDDDIDMNGEVVSLIIKPQTPRTPGSFKQQQQQHDVDDEDIAASAAGGDVHSSSKADQQLERQQSKASEGDVSKKGRLVKAEERAKGQVRSSVYMAYLCAWGPLLLLPIAVALGAFIERGLQVLQNYVLSIWSNATSKAQSTSEPLSGYSTQFYLMLYFVLGLGSVGIVMARSALLVVGSIAASRQLHHKLLIKMLRLPMSFYDSQPTGRLINRFTKDTEALDIQMAAAVNSALTCLVGALLSIVVVVVVSPYTAIALVPLGLLYYRVQRLYIATSRELKRLDALAFSPIFQHYGESLAGLATIRAFGRQQLFTETNRAHIEQSNRAWWPIQLLNRWLSMRLELTGAIVVFICAVAVGVLAPRNAGLAGLALTSALNLTGTLAWMVRQTTELEVNMNSVERLVEYHIEPEEAAAVVEPRPPPTWPQSGTIEAVQLVVRYRPELPAVLKGLTFSVKASEKVGICGRTGCGKSTLMMVLFRMVEPCGGAILIDGLDTSKLGLTDLRSRLSLVPQDPVIFSGTVRSNLDPFDQAGGDAAIWEALRQAGIDGLVRSLGAGLDSSIQEGGNNLSSGQRQLLCMARALLRHSRILILDEATSNVDHASDALIQSTIRSAFSHCTVLTIAHRLHTISDADRVMVLDQGQLLEFDTPAKLMIVPGGVFRGLMEEASRQHHRAATTNL